MTGVHSSSLLGLLLILVFLFLSRADVHEHPATQVVAAGQNTRFNCTASGRSITWIITIPPHGTVHILDADGEPFQGFTPIDSPIPPDDSGRHENGTFTLVAEGRIENNNTRVCCVVQIHSGGSSACPEQPDQAHLIVIGVPSEPGNFTVVVEKDHLIVQWTAPYAHPGYSILLYTLQMNNSESAGSIQTELSGNSTEDVVNITKIGSDCDMLTVSLTACNRVGMGSPALSEVTLPIFVGNVSCDVHCQFLDQDHAIVNVIIEFPQLCLQQQFKYNVVLMEEGADEVIAHESAMAFYSGSNLLNISFGSEVIRIDSDYLLAVQFKTPVTYVSSSTLCTFNTYVNKTMTNSDRGTHELIIQVAIGCIGGLALALSAVLLVTTVLLSICCKRRRSIQGTIRRASNMQQSMAENPIYDSPLYDSIQEYLRPVLCHPQVQESLYTESPGYTSSSGGQSVRDRKNEETARSCHSPHCAMQSCGDCDSDSGKGGAGGSKTCDDGYVPMQSICTKDHL